MAGIEALDHRQPLFEGGHMVAVGRLSNHS